MKKQRSLHTITTQLEKLSFNQAEQLGAVAAVLVRLSQAVKHAHNREHLEIVLDWFTHAHTLRAPDFKGVAEYICKKLEAGESLPPQLVAALLNYRQLPPKSVQRHIMVTERGVQRGNYDRYITRTARAKYRAAVRAMKKDPELKKALAEFRERNPDFCRKKKMRRRTMMMERNFKPKEWYFTGADGDLARLDFDALCYRFNLFGLEDYCQTPLLQKLSVNATPHGIMIFIPRYWSLDHKRDLNWSEINKLLKCWGMLRQGETFSYVRLDSAAKSKATFRAFEEASKRGWEGEKRKQYAIVKAHLRSNISDRSFFRILKKGREHCAAEKATKVTGKAGSKKSK